jgi:hypothetical protein
VNFENDGYYEDEPEDGLDLSAEVMRSGSLEEIRTASEVLDVNGIPYQVSNAGAVFDVTTIGSQPLNDYLIKVTDSDLESARSALENHYTAKDLPRDHFLRTATDEDIVEILASPLDWDAFTVAHARRIAATRAINPDAIKGKREERIIEKREEIKVGKAAPTWLLVLGWASALMGGLIGIGIGYSLSYMKEETPEGRFYTYNESSRRRGSQILFLSVVMVVVWIAII